jgi:ParB-like chromosome segregation protein Spo0J
VKSHKLANYFPIIEGEEFDLLVESIRKNGQREPIVIYDGQILDGINRWRACERLGIEPVTKELPEGEDPLQYVVDENIRRRHMDVSQRAMLATEMEPEFAEKARANLSTKLPGGETRRSEDRQELGREAVTARAQTAKVFGVSGPTIQRAKRVKQEAPDRVADIVSGKTTVAAVDAELRQKSAATRDATKQEHKTEEKSKRDPVVSEYFAALKGFKEALQIAVKAAQNDRFSPESIHMIKNRHSEIEELMANLEDAINDR